MSLNLIQQKAVKKMSTLKAGALFMKMGTGKTKTALDLAYSRKNHFDYILWIAPASLIYNAAYKEEIAKWNKGINIVYYSIESISQSDLLYLDMRDFAEKNDVFCIVDESLTIKNTDAKRVSRLLSCRELFKFRLILNGTPLSKGLIDLYSQIQFISPRILNMTETQFAHNFLQFFKDGQKPWRRWSRPENEEALIEIIRPYIFDTELDIDVRKNVIDVQLILSPEEEQKYTFFKNEFLENRTRTDFLHIAQKFQAAYTCTASKIEYLKTLSCSKCIVFVKFIHEIDELLRHYPNSMEYSGRAKACLKNFQDNNSRFLIMTYGTGAMGLNLQFCQNVVFFSQTFNWKDKEHGLHRVYRIGQKYDVNIYHLWLNTGLEQIIKSSLEKKEDVARNVGNYIKNKGLEKL